MAPTGPHSCLPGTVLGPSLHGVPLPLVEELGSGLRRVLHEASRSARGAWILLTYLCSRGPQVGIPTLAAE